DQGAVPLPRALGLRGEPKGPAVQAERGAEALGEILGKAVQGGARDVKLGAGLGVVPPLPARPRRAGVAPAGVVHEVPDDGLGRPLRLGRGGVHRASARSRSGAPFAAARACSIRSSASSRLTSWPRSRFQTTNPQPGWLRLFQLVQPYLREGPTISPPQPGGGGGPGGTGVGAGPVVGRPGGAAERAAPGGGPPAAAR